jgi:hypothetical protein
MLQLDDSLQQELPPRGMIRALTWSLTMTMTTPHRLFLRTLLMASVACVTVSAQAGVSVQIGGPVLSVGYRSGHHHGHHHGHGGHGGYYRGGWGWGLTPLLLSPWIYPQVVTVVQPAPVVIESPPPPAAAPARPDPVIYPRNGQSAPQLEADRQECNRWATTQPAALADSSVFMRAVDACMDGRGYTTK